ncbi:hypothetical protein AZE42_00451 [Rhizopogon vesiculosus]|uniref:YVC1 N-terminal linker helical domain-containing protein n=1 Tax=Rhizopogon vesiculosus TaxID=180088 RepID=A0A1J8QCB4_9AGAM|nr:hypothetical protein AZE42_00451 [Rhizopogon vesiculosus]
MYQNQEIDDEQASLISSQSKKPTPDTLTKLVKRLRALTTTLLPVEVDEDSINDPTSRIITPNVISAFSDAAGDFVEALPYCLLRAHAEFMKEAYRNPADFGENRGRAVACEVLARRIVHQSSAEKVKSLMSTRYRHIEADGDISEASSALEIAIDTHCTIFLSSTEAQGVVRALWNGELVQTLTDQDDIQYVSYHKSRQTGFWGHVDPTRISVPRYQNILRIVIWFFFLIVYSQAVRQPLERLDPNHGVVDVWEIILYIMALAFSLEELITIFDGYQYVGTMQICVARMLQESGIFFALLSVLGIGFWQGLYALDAADGESENASVVIHVLVQGLLQSPNYDRFSASPVGLALYYLWNITTAIILLNVLISLFSSAYSDVVGDAEAEYMTFYAGKTVAMTRAPDSYVYPAPFNLVEFFFVAPFEIFTLNRVVMRVIFFIPLTIIALYETSSMKQSWMVNWLRADDEVDTQDPFVLNPVVEGSDAEQGLEITKVPFDDLIKSFPDTTQSSEATILKEIRDIQQRLEVLTQRSSRFLHT